MKKFLVFMGCLFVFYLVAYSSVHDPDGHADDLHGHTGSGRHPGHD